MLSTVETRAMASPICFAKGPSRALRRRMAPGPLNVTSHNEIIFLKALSTSTSVLTVAFLADFSPAATSNCFLPLQAY